MSDISSVCIQSVQLCIFEVGENFLYIALVVFVGSNTYHYFFIYYLFRLQNAQVSKLQDLLYNLLKLLFCFTRQFNIFFLFA